MHVTSQHARRDELICWSRMQAEAGQTLDVILARKERERAAGQGLFFWGVGNAPAVITHELARKKHPISVVFSVMKSQPRTMDSRPNGTLVWQRYIDAQGEERPIPSHVLVTSRSSSGSRPKKSHYALTCWSENPLRISRGEKFDPSAYRNASGTGASVGASQVTALLRRVYDSYEDADYEVNLRARLVGSYWVRLVAPLRLTSTKFNALTQEAFEEKASWVDFVASIRSDKHTDHSQAPRQVRLL